jgi:hypothetical protein
MIDLVMPYGENGITFTLFDELASRDKVKRLLWNISWGDKDIPHELDKDKIERIYLFPDFGKRYGPGEPDAIMITRRFLIFFELETEPFAKKTDHLSKQLKRFFSIGRDLLESKAKRVSRKRGFLWPGYSDMTGASKSTRGLFRSRKIFKDLLGGRNPIYVVITADSIGNAKHFFSGFPNQTGQLGFISYGKIKRMKDLPRTKKVIDFNLQD